MYLDHLGHAIDKLALVERLQEGSIDEDVFGLAEGSD